jgi:hypothetical protein
MCAFAGSPTAEPSRKYENDAVAGAYSTTSRGSAMSPAETRQERRRVERE